LVGASVNWPYGIALDESNFELLVANYNDTVIVAISLSHWGTFDRSANLAAPIPGVRKIAMSTGITGYRPFIWGFREGLGIAAHPSFGMLAYESEGTTHSASLYQSEISLTSDKHHLVVFPDRETWYTLVTDPSRPQSVREAIEERSITTLAKSDRFESRFLETPALDPRAFAVNTQTHKLYVAYNNKAIVEVFTLE
jgi:DNA-binding beta-propeller fold protein YncE